MIAGVPFVTQVDWLGDEATIKETSRTYTGRVVGMRAHDDGFKFSVLYTDAITGESEMSIFSMPNDRGYRLGIVHYDRLDDGTRVLASMEPFEDAVCAVIY